MPFYHLILSHYAHKENFRIVVCRIDFVLFIFFKLYRIKYLWIVKGKNINEVITLNFRATSVVIKQQGAVVSSLFRGLTKQFIVV